MLSGFIGRFCGKPQAPQNTLSSAEASAVEDQGSVLSQYVTFGAHLYRQRGEVAEVVFTHKSRHIAKTIIDDYGNIRDFPGFDEPEKIRKCLGDGKLPEPVIRFRTDFEREPDGRFLMIWEIQPDGRYWEDEDGFGGTSDIEVRLYSHIDESGRFTEPFRLYNAGSHHFLSDLRNV